MTSSSPLLSRCHAQSKHCWRHCSCSCLLPAAAASATAAASPAATLPAAAVVAPAGQAASAALTAAVLRHGLPFVTLLPRACSPSPPTTHPPTARWIHEYQLTPHSLYAAVSIGLETDTIVAVLGRLSKNVLPPEIKRFVRGCTQNYGKVRGWLNTLGRRRGANLLIAGNY